MGVVTVPAAAQGWMVTVARGQGGMTHANPACLLLCRLQPWLLTMIPPALLPLRLSPPTRRRHPWLWWRCCSASRRQCPWVRASRAASRVTQGRCSCRWGGGAHVWVCRRVERGVGLGMNMPVCVHVPYDSRPG